MTRLSTSRNSQQIYKRFTPIFSAALSVSCRLELPCAKQVTAHIAQVMLQQQICISVAVIILSLLFSKSFSVSNINSTIHHKHGSFLCRQPMRETEVLGEKPTPLFTSWDFSKNQLTKKKVTWNSDENWWRCFIFTLMYEQSAQIISRMNIWIVNDFSAIPLKKYGAFNEGST